jgi:hypothetical protein
VIGKGEGDWGLKGVFKIRLIQFKDYEKLIKLQNELDDFKKITNNKNIINV